MCQATDSVQSRTGGDPCRSLVAPGSVLSHLASHGVADLFKTEMAALLAQLTPCCESAFCVPFNFARANSLCGPRKLVDQGRKPYKQVPVHKP